MLSSTRTTKKMSSSALQPTVTIAAHSVLRPLCLLWMAAADAHVRHIPAVKMEKSAPPRTDAIPSWDDIAHSAAMRRSAWIECKNHAKGKWPYHKCPDE